MTLDAASPVDEATRRAIFRILSLVQALNSIHPGMSVAQGMALLVVAEYPGISVSDLARRASLTLASASRTAQLLADGKPPHGKGLKLVYYDISTDARLRPLRLTPKGREAVQRVLTASANPQIQR